MPTADRQVNRHGISKKYNVFNSSRKLVFEAIQGTGSHAFWTQ